MFDRLRERGFEIEFRSHSEAILGVDFPEVAEQLEGVLLSSTLPIEEIIGSGGGETKGTQRLRNALASLLRRIADDNNINSHEDMERIGLKPTRRQIRDVMKRVTRNRNPIPFRDAWTDQFVSDKFGMATTHWSKLQDRVQRGVGNP